METLLQLAQIRVRLHECSKRRRPTAELLTAFEEPSTIVNAVLRYAKRNDVDPNEVLEAAYPIVKRLLLEGLLAEAGSVAAESIRPSMDTETALKSSPSLSVSRLWPTPRCTGCLDAAEELALESALAPQLQDERSKKLEIARHGLCKGRIGIAVLASDLQDRQTSAMPLFENPNWQIVGHR